MEFIRTNHQNKDTSREYSRHQEESQNYFTKSDSSSRNRFKDANSGQWNRSDRPEFKSKLEEWEWCKNRLLYKATRETFLEKEAREKNYGVIQAGQQQGTRQTFPTYDSTVSYAESNRQARGMISSSKSASNLIATLNSLDSIGMTSNTNTVHPSIGMNVPVMEMTRNSTRSQVNLFSINSSVEGNSNVHQMMGRDNFGQYNVMTDGQNIQKPVKQIIRLTKSVLYPPSPNLPQPITRKKPLGCKTAFVKGLPEKITKDIIKEIFETCGEILQIHMSTKDFCRVRFSKEEFVLKALYFSGYEIRIANKNIPGYIGLIHIDYAESREDQYEYEQQKAKILSNIGVRKTFRPPTPPPVVHYSDHGATVLGDKLKKEDTFHEAAFVLITWLERGDCNKKTSGFFYSMIQSTNSHVRRLINEKLKYEDELDKAKIKLKKQMQGILIQLKEVEKVFSAASLKKVWDHFTKTQRRNIVSWKQKTLEIKNAHVKEVLDTRVEDEMEFSDNDEDCVIKENNEKLVEKKNETFEELKKLQEENSLLRSQVDAAQNITRMLLRSRSEESKKEIEGMQKQISSSSKRKKDAEMNESCSKKMRQEEIIESEKNDKDINKSNNSEIEEMQKETSLSPESNDNVEWYELDSIKESQENQDAEDENFQENNNLEIENGQNKISITPKFQDSQNDIHEIEHIKKEIKFSPKLEENVEPNKLGTIKANNETMGKFSDSDKDWHSVACYNPEMERRVSLGLPAISSSDSSLIVTESEIRMVGLISTFLIAHPYGVSTNLISVHLHKLGCSVKDSHVESLMKCFPSIFKEELTDVDNLEKNWTFSGFKSV